jgi:hypothetical protein
MVTATNRKLASCAGKERFNTYRRARQVGKRVAQRRHEAIAPYPCQFCGGFHLGTHVGPSDATVAYGGMDARQRYAVFAVKGNGPSTLVGFSNAPNGGRIAEIIKEEGWRVTNITERWRKAR